MPVPSHIVSCTKNVLIAREIYDFRFTRPKEMTFKPGQFVLFDVGLIENPADIQTRALSIASHPSEDELIFVAKMKEGGRASRWIMEKLQVGDTVRMQGPFGNFLLDQTTPKEYLFIATSTGVAPFRSQIMDMLRRGDTRRIDLVYGVRSEEDVFWKDELTALTQKYDNFFLHIALSKPSDSWKGHVGRVQTLVPMIVKDFSNKCVYVCGSPDMTKELKQTCLEQWGIQKGDLHVEGYI
jgi:NAD(P)H-flavin reductase